MRGRDYKRTPRRKAQPRQRLLPAWIWILVGFVPPSIIAILIYLDKIDVRLSDPNSGSTQTHVVAKTTIRSKPTITSNKGGSVSASRGGNDTQKVLVSKKPDGGINFSYKKDLTKDVVLSSDFSRNKVHKNSKAKQIKPKPHKKPPVKLAQTVVKKNKVKRNNKKRFTKSYLQVGAFNKKSQAQTHRKRLAKFGIKATIITFRNKGKNLYRVRIGPFVDSASYNKSLRLLTKNKVKAFRTNK